MSILKDKPISVAEPDVRCPACRRLLFRGQLVGEIRCRCGYLMRFARKLADLVARETDSIDTNV